MNGFRQDIKKEKTEIIQINLGNRCNQTCEHCHVNGSPEGDRNMDGETADNIIDKLIELDVDQVEFTGGAPEMNANLPRFIEKLSTYGKSITVRTNLSVLDCPEFDYYFDLYKKFSVNLVASLPCYGEENVDKQRGQGTFDKSIRVLKKLNGMGYGKGPLKLNLVYNPGGAFLPGSQSELEEAYKENLLKDHGIVFDSLITIANNPINRFREKLEKEGCYDSYVQLLKDSYNENNLGKLMCKRLISVDFKGNTYDCDFNQVLGMKMDERKFWDLDLENLDKCIKADDHCFACTAGSGSSCYGALE